MGYVWQRWLAVELRAAGLDVVEVDGWVNRGRPASTGGFSPSGLVVHHTGTRSSPQNPAPSLRTLIEGRSDLSGPICHIGTDYNGVVYVVAAGRANVNGRNRGVSARYPRGDGNAQLLGHEVMTDGRQPLPAAQRDSIALSSAVIVAHFGGSVDADLWRHEDTSTTGKWDIGQLTTAQVRGDARGARPTRPGKPIIIPQEDDDMLLIKNSSGGGFILLTGGRAIGLADMATVRALKAAGVKEVEVANRADFDRIAAA